MAGATLMAGTAVRLRRHTTTGIDPRGAAAHAAPTVPCRKASSAGGSGRLGGAARKRGRKIGDRTIDEGGVSTGLEAAGKRLRGGGDGDLYRSRPNLGHGR